MHKKESKPFSPRRSIKWKKLSENSYEVAYTEEDGKVAIIGKVFKNNFMAPWYLDPYFNLPVTKMGDLDETFENEIDGGRRLADLWELIENWDVFAFEDYYEKIF
tara:strand:+ start:350 stop:664 length:315 start_codon:yes stop_codon:yes gene_type:complete